MKKLLILILAMLSVCMEGIAQVSGLSVGYCDGEWNAKGNIKSTKKDAWVSAAIYIPAGTMNTYAGNRIDSIKVALASKLNIDEMKVWIREDLNGENLAEGSITGEATPALAKGWNEIVLDKPYDIGKSDNGLYIGYSYHQKGTALGISALTQPTPNGLFIQLPGEEWADKSTEGTLCIEALVFGDKLPKINLALLKVEAQKVFVIDKGKMDITGEVKNLATQTISGFDVQAKIDGIDKAYTAHVDMILPYKATKYFNVTINPDIKEIGTGNGKVTVTITNINEGEDEDPTDNTFSDEFNIVDHDFTRNVLVEEFTTEQCGNCPRMASWIHDALEKDEFKDNIFVVCHHSGYYTDWLTKDCDAYYLWFYNGGSYAPAIMIDRNTWDGTTPVLGPNSQAEMEAKWSERLEETAFVSVNVKAEIIAGETDKLKINVNGSKSIDKLCDNPRLMVFLLEDNVAAKNQSGAANFIHNHVNRAYNSTWGEPITWNGNDYSYTCEFSLNKEWKRENLQIVAFIYNYDEAKQTNCIVENVGGLRSKDFETTTGINDVNFTNEANTPAEYYTLSGEKISSSNMAKGIYIVKMNNTTKKVVFGE